MFKNHISAGIASFLMCAGLVTGLSSSVEAATTVNNNRDDVAYHREAESKSRNYSFQYEPQEGVRVGYIITGDDQALLDDETMGYIRRVLHTKFPGTRYPVERIENIDGHIHQGRRNTGDTYILTEAHDVLALEFEKLEEMHKKTTIKRTVTDQESKTVSTTVEESGSLDYNTYDYTPHLSTLPKDDYVQFVRELEDDGMAGYDYLLLFNFKPLRTNVKTKLFGKSRQTDFRLSVRAIDVATGRYIDRGEYHSRGSSGGAGISLPLLGYLGSGPSWRRAMRKSMIEAMIESFDHMPIGKYSICDNPYCARRQDEIRMERVFGKNYRHCVKHCNDKTFCGDHMVDYHIDADLPSGYVKGQKDELYIKD